MSADQKTWASTGVQNLLRNGRSGRYYARFIISGKPKWVSLKTDKRSVAVLRLNDERQKFDKMRAVQDRAELGDATMGELLRLWCEKRKADVGIGERTKARCEDRVKALRRTWPDIDALSPAKITRDRVFEWRNRIRREGDGFSNPLPGTKPRTKGASAGTVNRLIDTLRVTLDLAVERGQIAANPLQARGLKLPVKARKPQLPEAAVLEQLYASIESPDGGNSPASADFCRGLNYTGMRLGEAAALTWKDVLFERGIIRVNGTKTDSAEREVPMTRGARNLFMKLLQRAKERAKEEQDGRVYVPPSTNVFTVSEATVSLSNACKRMGISRLTHHDLRDAFATACIEAGVDIPTVAAWLGHKDGGALLMRTYAHHRRKHSLEQAAKVSFGSS